MSYMALSKPWLAWGSDKRLYRTVLKNEDRLEFKLYHLRASLVAQWQRTHLRMQEMQAWSLVQNDPLQKEMVTCSSILAREIPWTEEPGRLYSPWGCERVRYNLMTKYWQYAVEWGHCNLFSSLACVRMFLLFTPVNSNDSMDTFFWEC